MLRRYTYTLQYTYSGANESLVVRNYAEKYTMGYCTNGREKRVRCARRTD